MNRDSVKILAQINTSGSVRVCLNYYFCINSKMRLECHPFYPYTEEEKRMIHKELGLKNSILQEDIDAILDWFYKEPHLAGAPIDRDHIEKILISSKGSREKAKRRINNFYKYRSYSPELVQERIRDLSDPDFDPWTFYYQCAMLKLYNGKRISVFTLTDPNPSKFISEVVLRNTILLADLRLRYDYMAGDIWILDLQNASIGHVFRVNLAMMHKFSKMTQEGVGFKINEIHIVNAPSFTQHLLTLFKKFAKPKIIERLQFHSSIEELQRHVPKQYLPKDYGGEQPSLEEFREMYKKELLKSPTKDYLIESCRKISDEQKRNDDDRFHEEYLIGSFKKLEVD